MKQFLVFLGLAAMPGLGQPLSLREAVRMSLEKHPALEAAAARTKAAEARVGQARSGYYPKLGYTEFVQGSNNPVFAFGTLLNQRRFTAADFDVGRLNSPGFIANFQSQIMAEEVLYDFGATREQVRTAGIGRQLSQEEERAQQLRRVAEVARSYERAVLLRESLGAARAAVRSAQSDLERAEAVRNAGMSTDADVLTIRVHLAAVREQEIRLVADQRVALAALNEAMGLPLDQAHELRASLVQAAKPEPAEGALRPEQRQAALQTELSEAQRKVARTALYPQIVARGVFEADRNRFVTGGGTNWWVGGGLRWNFDTGRSVALRAEEAAQNAAAARAGKRQVDAAVALQVAQAQAAFDAAVERIAVADAAVTQAEESLRIMKNRYEAGLSTVNDLLRNETALLDTRTRRLRAIFDQRVAAVEVEFAAGRLTGDSHVLD